MSIQKVGVVGCGLMGSGIAEVAARAGFDVLVREIDDAAVDAGRSRIHGSMERAVEREKLSEEDRAAALDRLTFTTDLTDFDDRQLVIEAIVEEKGAKHELFGRLDEICPPEAVLASNTSSLTITEMAVATDRPGWIIGLHFFNPVPVMNLVEVVRTLATTDDALRTARDFVEALGKESVTVRDTSGFVVNRLLVPYMLDAIRQFERGLASIEEIDRAMSLGARHPMGPFTLCDFVGLDTLLRISEIMFEEYRERRYAAPPLLRRMVALGRFGKKAGEGFYDWTGDEPVAMVL